jgi:hypothetical protein
LVSHLDYISPLIRSQRQIDVTDFDFSSAFDLVSHTLLMHRLTACGLSDSYVSCLQSYITNRYSGVQIHGTYSTPFEVLSGVPQGSVLGLFRLMYLLRIFAILLNTLDIFYLLMMLKYIAP